MKPQEALRGPKSSQEAPEAGRSSKKPQEAPRGPNSSPGSQEAQRGPKSPQKAQEARRGPKRPQEVPRSPRRPQEAPRGPKRPQKAPRGPKRATPRSQRGEPGTLGGRWEHQDFPNLEHRKTQHQHSNENNLKVSTTSLTLNCHATWRPSQKTSRKL